MDFSYQLHVLPDTLDSADPSAILKGNVWVVLLQELSLEI